MNVVSMKKQTAGLTLVELLVVIVIVGILAGFAVRRQRGVTGRARLAAAAADARAIRSAEAAFHADSGRYADLATLTQAGYAPQVSPGSEVIIALDPQGYTATVAIGEGQGGGGGGGGCRVEVSASHSGLACSAAGVPPTTSGNVPGTIGAEAPPPEP
jgi:prepilin-type N-terminal cleavage/methylation domain-containing protein